MTGEKILNYKIENLTEENQVFRSFLATHTQFAKKVIVKTLKPLENPEEKAEFDSEIRKLSGIQHPNIITLYDRVDTTHDYYLVFEHIEGRTLGDYIHQVSGPIPEEKAKVLFLKILDAFQFAHSKEVMNGAINPENILISKDENVKVLDLALSKFYNEKYALEAENYAYLSPEHLQNPPLDKRSDIYSLGVVLFQMLSGKYPYPDLSAEEVKNQILTNPLPPVSKFYPIISAEMQAIVNKATTKNPNQRFQTCEEFREALLNFKATPVLDKIPDSVETLKKNLLESEEFRPVNIALYSLIFFASLLLILLVYYNTRTRALSSSIVYELRDVEKINQIQDSIAKAKAKRALEDSLRIFQDPKKKDTVQVYFHKVKRGESLESIARLYYIPLDTLKKLNGMTGKEKLKPKEGIKVRVRDIYKLKKGENIYQVAQKYRINAVIIKQVNGIFTEFDEEGNPLLLEGKDLVIPLNAPKF